MRVGLESPREPHPSIRLSLRYSLLRMLTYELRSKRSVPSPLRGRVREGVGFTGRKQVGLTVIWLAGRLFTLPLPLPQGRGVNNYKRMEPKSQNGR